VAKQKQAQRVTHFGQFVRWHRVNAGLTADAYARQLGLTGRRLFAIEAMPAPAVNQTTLVAIAKSMGLATEDLDAAWRSKPVPHTPRRSGPTTDAAQRFAAACRLVGVEVPEGLRRLRRWFLTQPEDLQRAALSYTGTGGEAEGSPRFTAAVDHLQDPAAVQARRVGGRARQPPAPKAGPGGRPAASSARPPGPAATSGSRRR
jgi:hypothetical protein